MEHNIYNTSSIAKFNIKGNTLYIKVFWKKNQNDFFTIKIFTGDVMWSGRFSNEFAKKYRERFEETEEQYYRCVKKCLKGSEHGEYAYDFTISAENSDSANFTWKKRFEDSVHGLANLVYGSVPVYRETAVESNELLLEFLLAENKELRTTIDCLKGKNELIVTDLKKCKTELEKFVDIKTSLETSLYGKFVQLLNAKKRRIQMLEEGLQKFSSSKEFCRPDL